MDTSSLELRWLAWRRQHGMWRSVAGGWDLPPLCTTLHHRHPLGELPNFRDCLSRLHSARMETLWSRALLSNSHLLASNDLNCLVIRTAHNPMGLLLDASLGIRPGVKASLQPT